MEINEKASSQVLENKSQNEIEDLDFPPPPPFPNKVVESKREEQKMISVGENMSIVIQRKFPNTFKKSNFYILEIPFLKTCKFEVDIQNGALNMEVDGVTLIFNIFKAMRYPTNDDSILSINLVDFSMQDILESNGKVELDVDLEVQNSKKSWMQIEEPKELQLECAKIIVVQPSIFIQRILQKIKELYMPSSPINWEPPRLIFDPGG